MPHTKKQSSQFPCLNRIALAIVGACLLLLGCGETQGPDSSAHPVTDAHHDHGHSHDDHEGHPHAADGHTAKHGGHLIELGTSHQYHAELVDDHETETLIVYLMDGDLAPAVFNEASVSLVVTAVGQTKRFALQATPGKDGPAFSSSDSDLMEMIEAEDTQGKLRATIDGKPFSASFKHQPHGDHSDHGHDH